jgi:hypothetical protein
VRVISIPTPATISTFELFGRFSPNCINMILQEGILVQDLLKCLLLLLLSQPSLNNLSQTLCSFLHLEFFSFIFYPKIYISILYVINSTSISPLQFLILGHNNILLRLWRHRITLYRQLLVRRVIKDICKASNRQVNLGTDMRI